jgi:lysophospholipase L1-like esterase
MKFSSTLFALLILNSVGCDEGLSPVTPTQNIEQQPEDARLRIDTNNPDLAFIVPARDHGLVAPGDMGSDQIDPDATAGSQLDATIPQRVDAEPAGPDAQAPSTQDCLNSGFRNPPTIGPNYDQFNPAIGRHCMGTNHQVIENIERVVFIGDSVTVGTPPQVSADFFRTRLAHQLAARFGIAPPDAFWQEVNLIDGTSLTQRSGAFASCAKYGARTDDLLQDNTLLSDCFEADDFDRRTLVIMTIGGNDISSLTQDGIAGVPPEDLWAQTESFVSLMRDAVSWLRWPGRFPNGISIIYANMFEFTDGTGDVTSCPAAGLAGFGAEWEDPDLLAELVIWANEQYLSIAVDFAVDMVFMLEHFCGHGFNADNPAAPCYRGPDAETWFDFTCIHPNAIGHAQIERLFLSVVDE